jgi:hypothetical protein
MGDTTTIEMQKATRTRLKVWKAKRELTYDEAIVELLDAYEEGG